MLFRARTTLFVDDRLVEAGNEFTPDQAKRHKPGGGWEPIDDEAKVAYKAAGSPMPYTGTVEIPVMAVPVDWRAEAEKAGWQAPKDVQPAPYTAAPPVAAPAKASSPAAGSAPAVGAKKPVTVDDGEI